MRSARRVASVLLALSVAPALVAPASPAAAAPTNAVVLKGKLDRGTFTTVAALQRVRRGRARLVVMRRDSRPSRKVYDLVVLRGRSCRTNRWARRVLARVPVRNARPVDVRRRVRDRILRAGLSLAIVERRAGSGGFGACARTRRWGRTGEVVSPKDPATGRKTGVVAIWVPQGSPIWVPQGSPLRVAALVNTGTGRQLLGASSRGCDDQFTATDDLWQWRRELVRGFASFRQPRWDMLDTESIAVVGADTEVPAPPRACAEFPIQPAG